VINRTHPIARDLPSYFELENEEMYGEPFSIPEPLETILISWFQGGEVFRSGVTYQRGAGRIFYFRPGHETYPTYHNRTVQLVLRNAVCWAARVRRWDNIMNAPNVPVDAAPEPIVERGPKIHSPGEEGFR
jgi:trehalose utilization protein